MSLSLYSLSKDVFYFEATYHVGMLIAFAWTLGLYTRLLTPLTLVFWWSLQRANPGLWDGGDNLMQLTLVYCCFAEVDRHFSLTSRRPISAQEPYLLSRLVTLAHNAAVLAVALQVSVLYTVAGATKISGETWRNGTALYYALRPGEFYLPGVSEFLWSSRELLTVAAYCIVYLQAAFPLLIFLNRYSRRVAIVLAIGFHLGIMLVMGLLTFGAFMIAADLSLITDEEYRAAGTWLRRLYSRGLSIVSTNSKHMENAT